jgi:hypothetical protein
MSEKRNVPEHIKDNLKVFVVPVDIFDVPNLSIYDKMVYIVLRSFVNPRELTAFPSYALIAKLAGMTPRKAMQSMQVLIDVGLVTKETRFEVTEDRKIRQTSNLYKLENPNRLVGESHSPPPVNHIHPGGESHSPPPVNHIHPGGESHSHEQIHLTNPSITNPFNKSIYPKMHAWIESLAARKIYRLTDKIKIFHDLYMEMKEVDGFDDSLFIIVANRVLDEKPRNFKAYMRKALEKEIVEKKSVVGKSDHGRDAVPDYIRAQVERDRLEEKQREEEQKKAKVDQEELDRLIDELESKKSR